MSTKYLYHRLPSRLKVVSDEPLDDDRYVFISSWEEGEQPPASANAEPAEVDISEIDAITHAGGGWYDVQIDETTTVRVFKKEAALVEWRKSRR